MTTRRPHPASHRDLVGGLTLAVPWALLSLFACGGGSPSSPSTPGPSPTPTPDPATTVLLLPTGATPRSISVPVGSRVTFWNQDTQVHEIFSDPHPIHTDCPPINDVAVLAPGDSRATGVLTVARICGYHDHGMPTNTLFQGTIVIH